MPWFDIIDAACKIAGAFASIGTLGLIWVRAIPAIDKINSETNAQTAKIQVIQNQTNGLSKKVEHAAHAAGIIEGRRIAEHAIAASIELKAAAADVREALKKNGDSQ